MWDLTRTLRDASSGPRRAARLVAITAAFLIGHCWWARSLACGTSRRDRGDSLEFDNRAGTGNCFPFRTSGL